MAWVNNNKKNARFDPNRRDDRLMMSQVTSRRVHKEKREVEKQIELVSTDPEHVLSMGAETRLDWLQMALMQAGLGKLKVDALCRVLTDPAFGAGEGPARKQLKANVIANLHLFSAKQKKGIQEAVNAWGSGGDDRGGGEDAERRKRSRRRSSSSSSPSREKRKKRKKRSPSHSRSAPSRSRSKSRSKSRSRRRR